jgi:hypothetical protein
MFQNTPTTPAAGGVSGDALGAKKIDLLESQKALSEFSNDILRTFTQGRERIFELQKSLVDALPNVRRLGGDLKDVSAIISDVAQASRRNVVATSEEVEKLYAASKVLGTSAESLANSFLDVGIGIESIPKALEESMQYVQSIGGNAKQVFGDVSKNMDQMNRFQFEDGVRGLTKMAAQASMLRFDMGETFRLADKVLTPEGAIETAAAFQRLGVSAGNLVDPFQLMNQSINDPSGLQDSLVEVAKQFTYFDEKTKTFKITPQGVLTLRELQNQTGVSASEMTKLGLAAAEADKRLSAIDAAGLSIVNEEDKQYLANIAKMEGGTYKVTLEDGTKKELSELSQPEFDKLIQEQKEGPKTLEEIGREQLRTDEIIANDVAAILGVLVGGALTSDTFQDVSEGIRETAEVIGRVGGQAVTAEEVRDMTDRSAADLKQGLAEKIASGASATDIENLLISNAEGIFGELQSSSLGTIKQAAGDISAELGKNVSTDTGRAISDNLGPLLDSLAGKLMNQNIQPIENKSQNATQSQTGTNVTVGGISAGDESLTKTVRQNVQQNSNVSVNGNLNINHNFTNPPANTTPQEKENWMKIFQQVVNEQSFRNYIMDISDSENPLKPTASPYSS